LLDLTISIVSWNVKDLLNACLKSIFENAKNISFEVYVSDNASSDGSVDMVKNLFPQVKVIANKTNLGYPIANNQIIRKAEGRYIILLNPDTVITPGSLETLVKFMDEHQDAGSIGPRLEYPDGSDQPSCRSFPTLETELYRALFLDQIFPKSRIFGKYMMSYWKHNDTREVDQLMGAAMLVRKEVIDQIGLMDENIIFWFDEVDWCKRIKDSKWKIYFTEKAKIYHYKNKAFGQWKSLKKIINGARIWRRSRFYYFKKHFGILSAILVNIFDLLQITLVLGILYAIAKFIMIFGG